MNCETVKPLLSEFVDERLDASTAWQVQTHISECADCGPILHDLEALRRKMQALPTRQPSANFEAALAQRLALTRRPEKRQTWRDKIPGALRWPKPLLRPALALGVAVTAVGGVLLLPTHPRGADMAAVRSADHAFVADCVAQRRSDAAGEPLGDLSAQNLAGHLDNTTPGEPAGTTETDTGVF
ncbi:MAG: zf-HC2 domain-containing protein [Armatimonadota bacterium]|nr:zf-HC2 domain-containing protein [Armatimonadota bacterium]